MEPGYKHAFHVKFNMIVSGFHPLFHSRKCHFCHFSTSIVFQDQRLLSVAAQKPELDELKGESLQMKLCSIICMTSLSTGVKPGTVILQST